MGGASYGADLRGYDSVDDMLLAVRSGEVEAIVHDAPRMRYEVAQDCSLMTVGPEFEKEEYGVVLEFDSPLTRVIGVDTRIAPALTAVLGDLQDDGLITQSQRQSFSYKLAYGDGWPFHHHHMHFSWSWEDGYERAAPPEGCMTGPNLY